MTDAFYQHLEWCLWVFLFGLVLSAALVMWDGVEERRKR